MLVIYQERGRLFHQNNRRWAKWHCALCWKWNTACLHACVNSDTYCHCEFYSNQILLLTSAYRLLAYPLAFTYQSVWGCTPQCITLVRALSEPKPATTANFFQIQYFTTGSGADAQPQADNLQAVILAPAVYPIWSFDRTPNRLTLILTSFLRFLYFDISVHLQALKFSVIQSRIPVFWDVLLHHCQQPHTQ